MTDEILNGKPYAGNPHVAPSQRYGGTSRFDEVEVASAATSRRGSLLYNDRFRRGKGPLGYLAAAVLAVMAGAAFPAFGETPLYSWIGANGNFSDAGNWQNGAVPPAATPIDITINDNGVDIYVTNNITGLTPKSITLVGDGKIHLLGEKMTGLERVESHYNTSSLYRDFITAPVEFAGTMTIGGNMWIEFGDAKATTIAFDEAATDYAQRGLRGNVTLTGNWEVDRSLTIGSGTLEVQGTLSNTHSLTVNSDGKLISPSVTYTANSLLQGNAGTAEFGSVTAQGASDKLYFYNTNSTSATCSGVVRMGTFLNNATQNVRLNNATIVMGAGGFVYGPGANSNPSAWYNFSVGAGTTANVWPSADYSIGTNGNATTAQGDPKSSTNSRKDFSLGHTGTTGSTLNLYTTDYDDGSIARTVTIDGVVYGQQSSCKFNVRGIGVAIVNSFWKSYPGSVTVYDSATLQINPGCKPGTGTVTMSSGTALALPLTDTGAVSPRSFGTLEISGGLALAIDGATLRDGEYTLLSATTLTISDMSKVFVGGTAVAGKVATVVQDGNSLKLTVFSEYTGPDSIWTGAKDANLLDGDNWLGGVPTAENGRPAIIGVVHAATLVADRDFNPVSITFPEGSAKVTIAGTGTIGGIAAITNLSANTHTINVPVVFKDKILVIQNAVDWSTRTQSSICFAGGITGTDFAEGTSRYLNGVFTLTEAEDWVANTQGSNNRWGIPEGSSLIVPYTTNTKEIAVGEGASAANITAGGAFTAGVVRTSQRLTSWNQGEYVVTNELEMTLPDADRHLAWRCGDGPFKFEKVTLGDTGAGKLFYFANEGDYYYNKHVYIGAGGLNFAEGASVGTAYACGRRANDVIYLYPWHSDYAIGTKDGSTGDIRIVQPTYFMTTDENGVARTVTCNGIIAGSVDFRIDGAGKFVVNNVNTASGQARVAGTATLSINEGKVLTSGNVVVDSGATLEVASGVNTFGGLTLNDGATLAFNFTERAVTPQIAVAEGKTVTVNGAVKVKIADGSLRPTGGEKVLTTCGGFDAENVTVSLAAGAPEWVRGLSVNADGNIVLDVKPMGTIVIIK